jgi:hypothetical protein
MMQMPDPNVKFTGQNELNQGNTIDPNTVNLNMNNMNNMGYFGVPNNQNPYVNK